MRTRKLRNLEISAIGFGCMGFSHGYGPGPDRNEAIKLIRYAHDLGCTHFDTAEGYGAGHNELLVGEALAPIRDKVAIATKFFIAESTPDNPAERQIRSHLEASLKRLGTDRVELYYQHRISPHIPVEVIAECMGKLIAEGKILGWGQAQATAEQILRAHAVTPLTAIQNEYSMMKRTFERDVIPLCGELNIGFVPFSPLASGFLSGKVEASAHYEGDDVRRAITWFAKDNIAANRPLIDLLHRFAVQKNATPGCTGNDYAERNDLNRHMQRQPPNLPVWRSANAKPLLANSTRSLACGASTSALFSGCRRGTSLRSRSGASAY